MNRKLRQKRTGTFGALREGESNASSWLQNAPLEQPALVLSCCPFRDSLTLLLIDMEVEKGGHKGAVYRDHSCSDAYIP